MSCLLLKIHLLVRLIHYTVCLPCQGLVCCWPAGEAERKAFIEAQSGIRNVTQDKQACSRWSNFAADIEDEFAEDESNTCKNYGLHAGYGPWCFSTMDDITGRILWGPCYVNCHDAGLRKGLTDDRPHDEEALGCYWLRELPLPEPAYMANKSVACVRKRDQTCDFKPCVKWSVVRNLSNVEALGDSFDLDHNECRSIRRLYAGDYTPLIRDHRPWCYTSVMGQWGYCFEVCENHIKCLPNVQISTFRYHGKQNKSISGLPCLKWNESEVIALGFPSAESSNECRNYGHLPTGPFCVVAMKKTNPDALKNRNEQRDFIIPEPCFTHCSDSAFKCVGDDKMMDYTGAKNVSLGKRECQRWDEQWPHEHRFLAHHFGVDNLWMVSNYCRNPDADINGPWCFVKSQEPEVVRNGGKDYCFHDESYCMSRTGRRAEDGGYELRMTTELSWRQQLEKIAEMQSDRK